MSNNQLTVHRTLDAPRERVWRAFTDPDEVRQWWGPDGFTVPRCEMDVRPAGVHHVDMTGSLKGMEPVWSESLDSLATRLGEEV